MSPVSGSGATPSTKTPQQAEKEKLQKAWEDGIKESLLLITSEIPKLNPDDVDGRAAIYRHLLTIKEQVAQCGPAVLKAYNSAVDELFSDMDAIPGQMFLDTRTVKP